MEKITPLKTIAGDPLKPIELGDIVIPCYVLEGEIRVITETGLYSALGLSRAGRSSKEDQDEIWRAKNQTPNQKTPKKTQNSTVIAAELPRFAQAKWLASHISGELSGGLKTRYLFQMPSGGTAYGLKAQTLGQVCRAIRKAHQNGDTTERHKDLVRRIEILLDGFVDIGIIGLVDEATGFEKIKPALALAKILDEFIAKGMRPWSKEFPDAYYEGIYRLWEYDRPDTQKNHPQFIAQLTNKLIYKPLAPGVLEELQRINPMLENGTRKDKLHQYLSKNTGVIKLREQIIRIVTLFEVATSKANFERMFEKRFGTGQTYMEFLDSMN